MTNEQILILLAMVGVLCVLVHSFAVYTIKKAFLEALREHEQEKAAKVRKLREQEG